MRLFSIGDRVTIRHGQRKGQRAEIVEIQPAKVYKVKLVDGSILYYSGMGLQPEAEIRSSSSGHNLMNALQGSLQN